LIEILEVDNMLGRCRIRSVGNTLNRAAGGRTGCRRCGSLAEL